MLSPPRPAERAIDIDFENLIHLVGVRVEPEKARPGVRLAITLRWRCDRPPGDGWQLLTHITDESTDRSDNLDLVGALREPDALGRQRNGPEHWEAGKTYTETLGYVVPQWVRSGPLTVFVGIWKGDARLHVVAGPNDGENRGIASRIQVE